ncbi:MAG TPA: lysozyme [Gaiellaceae bacterium]|jgi:GH24 family phage-related lysozyme (muramidase)|nr:lysozyme [Gaiellaceae bacterium]
MPQLSERGARFIGRFEGWRDKPYNDAANHATIGYGHLIHMGPVTAHDNAEWGTLTQEAGIKLLQHDAGIAEAAITHSIKKQLSQAQHDALTSFAFNCGGGALDGSVGKAVNAGQDPTAALEQWDHAGHVELAGLLARRKAEAHLYMTGDYGDGAGPAQDNTRKTQAATDPSKVPDPVPGWAWQWVEWKLGRGTFKGHAADPKLRDKTGAPATIPPWGWTFLKRFQ